MRFINPTFLYAFAALAIPVIVHLFNFRRYKKILFPNIRFLKDVREQTRSKSRLKYLLILLARLLAFACLVMAFARPYLPVDDSKVSFNRKSVAVYLDNSFSMEATGERGSLFDEARNRATEILDAYKQTDRLCLL
ncbi:MAG: BatA domain-containing protein, partial [Bacteroidetes bacterium]|nr:BatA domain-containing protein [Bacteroidota bacterium]